MLYLILGVALWALAHLFKRLVPGLRASMGEAGKGVVAVLLLVSIGLMYIGYDPASGPVWWGRNGALVGINNLLMLGAFFLYTADGMRAPVIGGMRHPQLTGFSLWAVAHLLVNGDLASFILFGGLLAWALLTMRLINRAQPSWTPKPTKPGRNLPALGASVGAMLVVMLIHYWLGVQPWGA
ncbi:NnrU family protein [Rhodobacter ferrooxidans]|uniref:NnrUfamily protein n=1 Tax=Rhodobacter ferrooxidans TaxID=371731 RepID=C8S3C3_9RHOB|nr:NnrU family protein [Rhodobacter sp. SW2]EEW24488.1 NnrUfamily protein [Rhodobacter sp. SW2]